MYPVAPQTYLLPRPSPIPVVGTSYSVPLHSVPLQMPAPYPPKGGIRTRTWHTKRWEELTAHERYDLEAFGWTREFWHLFPNKGKISWKSIYEPKHVHTMQRLAKKICSMSEGSCDLEDFDDELLNVQNRNEAIFTEKPGYVPGECCLQAEEMTIEDAKKKCKEIEQCRGFHYEGDKGTTDVVQVYFVAETARVVRSKTWRTFAKEPSGAELFLMALWNFTQWAHLPGNRKMSAQQLGFCPSSWDLHLSEFAEPQVGTARKDHNQDAPVAAKQQMAALQHQREHDLFKQRSANKVSRTQEIAEKYPSAFKGAAGNTRHSHAHDLVLVVNHVTLQRRSGDDSIGLATDHSDGKTIRVHAVVGGLAQEYNQTVPPEKQIQAGDIITSVNHLRDFHGMCREILASTGGSISGYSAMTFLLSFEGERPYQAGKKPQHTSAPMAEAVPTPFRNTRGDAVTLTRFGGVVNVVINGKGKYKEGLLKSVDPNSGKLFFGDDGDWTVLEDGIPDSPDLSPWFEMDKTKANHSHTSNACDVHQLTMHKETGHMDYFTAPSKYAGLPIPSGTILPGTFRAPGSVLVSAPNFPWAPPIYA